MAHKEWRTPPQEFLARTDFIELREAMPELGTIGQEVRDVLIR